MSIRYVTPLGRKLRFISVDMGGCEIKERTHGVLSRTQGMAMTMPAPPSFQTHWIRSHPVLALALIVGAAAVVLGVTILYYLSSFISLPIL